jgi:hypothetical protein
MRCAQKILALFTQNALTEADEREKITMDKSAR